MMLAAIWKDQLIGPYFIDENVTGEIYLSVLQIFLCLMPVLDIPLMLLQKLI
jgi:hypothetical protein